MTLTLVGGCSNRYVIRLTNGNELTTTSKPHLDKKNHVFRFKNADGKESSIPQLRVSEIEPL